MQTALEIIGAFILTMMLISLVFKMQISTYESNIEATLTYREQSYSELLKEVLRNQIKNVGRSVSNIEKAITIADAKKLVFVADIDDDSVMDTVSIAYKPWVEDPTPTLNDRNVEFTVNGKTINDGFMGVTSFKFTYYDNNYNETTNTNDIQFVGYKFTMESEDTYGADAGHTDGDRAMAIGEGIIFLKCIWDW